MKREAGAGSSGKSERRFRIAARRPPPATIPAAESPAAPPPPAVPSTRAAGRRSPALAAASLLLLYLAVMSGHQASVDGLLMQRQAQAIVLDHSVRLRTPVWTWTGDPMWNSQYGIGQSLLYIPGFLVASPLASLVPLSEQRPRQPATFYYQAMYEDPLYTVGGSWVHAVIVALAAYLVARLTSALGCSRRAALWAMAFYGIGSVTFAYARGDFAQPLAGLCWTAALLAALRFRESGATSALWACAAIVGYGILTRPFEGLLLVPAVLFLMLPARPADWGLRALGTVLVVGVGALTAVGITLLVNWARFGDALHFGYSDRARWVLPEAARIAAVLVSPGRGILWQFPAIVLVPLGMVALARLGQRRAMLAIAALGVAMLVTTTCWHVWWGGWCWGLRLFLPAIPLLAVVAGAGVDRLGAGSRRWLPGLSLLAGLAWALPCVLTDPLAGYAKMADGPAGAWKLEAFPPYGAWQFLKRLGVERATDTDGVDILWFRLAHATGDWSLLVPVVLLALAIALVAASRRALLAEEREHARPSPTPAG